MTNSASRNRRQPAAPTRHKLPRPCELPAEFHALGEDPPRPYATVAELLAATDAWLSAQWLLERAGIRGELSLVLDTVDQ